MAEQESAFLRFLIQAPTQQAKLLLDHLTHKQLAALGEVCHNLLHGELSEESKKDLKSSRHLIRQLTDKKLSEKERRSIAARRAVAVTRILRLSEELLP